MLRFFVFFSNKHKNTYSLRVRLFLSFATLIATMVFCILPLFYIFNILDAPKVKIADALDNYLTNYEKSVSHQFDNIAAYSVQLNKNIVDEIEAILQENSITSFELVTDNPKVITEIETRTSKILESSLLTSKSSGAFLSLNATINSSLTNSIKTCSGVYIKISNLNNFNDLNPTIFLLRGLPVVADYNDIELHNMWEMEFDQAECMSHTYKYDFKHVPVDKRYAFLQPHFIKNTWEKVILVATPLIGKDGQIYGMTGLEISSLLYNLVHRHIQPSVDAIVGLIALEHLDEDPHTFNLDRYFSHGNYALTSHQDTIFGVGDRQFYDTFSNGELNYIAKIQDFNPSAINLESSSTKWHIAAILPKEVEEELIFKNNIFVFLFFAFFVVIAFGLSYVLVYRVSSPILRSFKKIKEGTELKTDIQEFNDLIEHIKKKEQELILKKKQGAQQVEEGTENLGAEHEQSLQADITAYHTFIEQLSTLTKSERKVFELYMQKKTAHDVADELNVSINTVRTHNRNIYGKLYVSSYKELMVYIQMMVGSSKFYDNE